VNAKGAFYLFPNISKTGLKSTDFCAKLLEAEKVAAVPGIAFGADDYIRISYATSMANIEKGLDRIDKFCRTLVNPVGASASNHDRLPSVFRAPG
jgi:aspartate aminotransferase